MRSLLVFILAALGCFASGTARAQVREEQPFRSSVSMGGSYVTGNVGQATATADVRLSYSAEQLGYDVLGNAFRLWIRPAPDAEMIRIGDTLAVTALPFWYFHEKFFLLGTGRYEYSQLRGLDGRANGGAGIGVTPVRLENRLLRIALGGQIEHARFVSSNLSPDGVPDGSERLVGRVSVQSNGWLRLKRSRLVVRYVGGWMINPVLPEDRRAFLDGSFNIELWRQLGLRLGGNVIHDTVVPEGIQPTDLRINAGFTWTRPARARPTGPS